jgi:hypothetical protein
MGNSQWTMDNGQWTRDSYLFVLDVLMMDINIRKSSLKSFCKDSCSSVFKYLVSFNSNNQYADSFASFKAMESLWIKSDLDSACSDSLTKAPLAVLEHNNCRLITYSHWDSCNLLHNPTILTAH